MTDENGRLLLSYRGFATLAGVLAAFLSAFVLVAGAAAALFLVAEGLPERAGIAAILTLLFAVLIALLVPRTTVTLYDDALPALTISQIAAFPAARFVVATPNGARLGILHASPLSRLGRHRWRIAVEGRTLCQAREESLLRALLRKPLGKFSRQFETNIRIRCAGADAGWIIRRPDVQNRADYLLLTTDSLDRRLAVALATVILGGS